MRQIRNQTFCWQEKKILRFLRTRYKGAELVKMRTLYLSLTEVDSDFNQKPIRYYTKTLATYSGLDPHWIAQGLRELKRLSIISIEPAKRDDHGRFAGNQSGPSVVFTPENVEESPQCGIPQCGKPQCGNTQHKNIVSSKNIVIEEENASSPSSDSPNKEPSLFAKLVKARKEHFSGLGDLQREFNKNTTELDALSDDDKEKLLDAYGKYLIDNSDPWFTKVNHSFAYFWKYRDRWYVAADPREKDEREKAKLEKEYGERRQEIASLIQQRLEFPDMSPEDQEKQRATSPGRKMAWEGEHLAKLISHAEQIGSRLNYLGTGQHICPKCAEDYVGKICACGFMEAAA